MVNFEIEINGQKIGRTSHNYSGQNEFPWCGLLLNEKTLDIKVDYSRYLGQCSDFIFFLFFLTHFPFFIFISHFSFKFIIKYLDIKESITVETHGEIGQLFQEKVTK